MAKQSTLHKSKLQKAQKAIEKGNFNEAQKKLLAICNKTPNDTTSMLLLASVYGRMNNFNSVADCCHKILSIEPNNTTALNYLGNVYTALHQHDKAIDCYTKSLDLAPNNPSTLNNLSTLLYSQKRFDEALNILKKVVKLKPDHTEALGNLANIFTDKGLFADAIECHIRLNTIQPDNPELLQQLGKSYYNSGNTTKAREVFLKALKLTKQPEKVLIALADTALHENNLDEAAEYLLKALEVAPDNIKARTGQANIWYRQGKFDRAYKRIKDLINSGEVNSNIINTYSEFCHRFDDCNFVVEHGENLLNNSDMTPHQRVSLHFNLGRVLDKAESFDHAFEHYKKGNDLMSVDYHPQAQSEFIDNIINAYTKDSVKSLYRATIDSEKPVFIVGMPRSGTSLAEQILASHSEVEGAGELKDIRDLITIDIPEKFNFTGTFFSYANQINEEQLNIASQLYLDRINTYSNNALRVTDKMPQNFLYIGIISQMFPNARIIHCKRNPLDTILSIYFQYFSMSHNYSFNLNNIAHYYLEYQRLMKHWNEALDTPIFELKYDSLVNNFESTCREMIDFTGLKWDDKCVNFHQSKRTIVTASFDQVRSPIYKSSINRWKYYEKHLGPLKDNYPALFEA